MEQNPILMEEIELISYVTAITAGGTHICGFTNIGKVKCWGENYFGQLGNGTIKDSGKPADVKDL
jgi:alpha-tubulin suppressor-like RCC1 family protein